MRRLLLFPALVLAACRAPERPVSQDKVVIDNARPAGRPKQSPEWFEEQIAAAWDDLRAGRIEEGLRRVVHARAQDPAEEELADLDDLLRRFNQAVLDLPTLAIAIESERDPIVFGEPVRVRVRIRNDGPRRVRVRARPAKGSPTLFLFDVLRTEYDIRAQVVQSRLQVHYPLRRDLDLPPRATTEIVVTVSGAGNDRPLDGFRTFTVGGRFRAGAIELDGLRRYEAIRMEPGTVRAFRPNYEHLAEDPVRRVRQAGLAWDAASGTMPVKLPDVLGPVAGPASLLCHFHDENLWNLRSVLVKGRLERRGDAWVFVGTSFDPPSMLKMMSGVKKST